MKLLIQILFLLIVQSTYSQTLEGKVIDSVTNQPIEYANITLMTKNKGVYANIDGDYNFDISKHLYDTLKISSIGYNSKFIILDKFKSKKNIKLDISLSQKITQLDEVVLNLKKKKYNKKHTIGEDKEGNAAVSSLIGYETCVLIENPFNKDGKLDEIYIKLRKRKNTQFIASLNIKFYSFDKINQKPGYELYTKKLIVKPKNRNYTLNIDVKDMDIYLPKEGMCIGVEFIDPNNESKKYDVIGPMYRFTYSTEENLTWSKYRGKDWRTGIVKFDYRNDDRTGNVMIGVDVLFPKE
ncbi:carboxypeptidase-like regulatory domain-containing protein [Mesoflavibacter zeaxanthinifaciens]|uniref:carboxypeptidase-like regulatory domain-containing protein n=1 Tax=Mesoflavibacter zeaxanthinifaciens TaxID=393060 RepID=UPI0026F091AE|nr:carboxypeptidase-like regulatory domain-containing protein [Mesoflavibacter zeaxanthinifaciens]